MTYIGYNCMIYFLELHFPAMPTHEIENFTFPKLSKSKTSILTVKMGEILHFFLHSTDHQFLIKNHLPFGSVSSHLCTYSICIKLIQFLNRIQKRRVKSILKSNNTTKILVTLVSTISKSLECSSVQLIHAINL